MGGRDGARSEEPTEFMLMRGELSSTSLASSSSSQSVSMNSVATDVGRRCGSALRPKKVSRRLCFCRISG